MFGIDPGPCPICGTAHCACGGGGPIAVVQTSARAVARTSSDLPLEPLASQAGEGEAADSALLGDGSDGRPFSTGSYRGDPNTRVRRHA